MFKGLAQFYIQGGALMFVTLTVGLVGLGIAIERAIRYYGDFNFDNKAFLKKVRQFLVNDQVDDAIKYCSQQKKGLTPAIVKAAVERYGCDEQLVKANVESAYLAMIPKVTVRVQFLSLIANVAVLLGLVGTVYGMIHMFGGLGGVDAATKQTVMATGIAEALHNTFQGLFIAVACMILHSVLSAKGATIVEELDQTASQSMDWVTLKAFGKLHESAK